MARNKTNNYTLAYMAILLAVAIISGAGISVTATNTPTYNSAEIHEEASVAAASESATGSDSTQVVPERTQGQEQVSQDSQDRSFATAATPIRPSRLVIPKIGVNAAVEDVGVNQHGNMGVPKDWRNVSWYEPGYLPGEAGNAVLAGHLDWKGNRAVFWDLDKLENGDLVHVVNSNGKKLSYVVTKKQVYDYRAQAAETVFGSQGASKLKLITCDGNYLDGQETYQNRYVVTARLVSSN